MCIRDSIVAVVDALEVIGKITGVSFNWKDTGTKSYGVIAQDLMKILPELVDINENGRMSVNYAALTAFLIESIKTLNARLELLENKDS